jgi:hypothetical protein
MIQPLQAAFNFRVEKRFVLFDWNKKRCYPEQTMQGTKGILFNPEAGSGLDGISVYVFIGLKKVSLIINERSMKSSTIYMIYLSGLPAHFLAGFPHKVIHRLSKISIRSTDDEMKMIVHKNERNNPNFVSVADKVKVATHDFPYLGKLQIESLAIIASS